MKHNLILLIALLFAFNLWADTPCLIVTKLDSSEAPVELANIQRLELYDMQIKILQKDNSESLINYSDIKSIVFDSRTLTPTSISQIPEDQISIYPNLDTNSIIITGLAEITSIQLYTISGVLVESYTVDPNSAEISMSKYSNDIYLLRVKNNTFKIVKQ